MSLPKPTTPPGIVIRSAVFMIGMLVSTVVCGPMVMLTFPLPFATRYRVAQQWTRFNIWWLKITCKIDYCLEGLEHLPTQPVIILSKHQSTWETLFLHQFLPPLAWVVKRELLWIPLFGWSLALLRPIAINRSAGRTAFRQLLKQGQACLDNGQWVLIFPEGTRTPPGTRGEYHSGGAMLAVRSGYAVLPIAHNAGEHWARHGFLKYPGTIRVQFGPLIESKGLTPKELNLKVKEWIEENTTRLSELSSSTNSQSTTENDKSISRHLTCEG